jgi:6-phosphogluconolactonase (cycloisomerase 2 family)
MFGRALLIAVLSGTTLLMSPYASLAQTGMLTVADNEPLPEDGPGDAIVVAVRRDVRYVVSLAFTRGEAVTHRMERDGQLTEVGRTPAGPEPRAIAMAHGGDLAVIANSIANEIGVFSVGDNGLLREINRVPVEGRPWDVDVAYGNIVLVVERDGNEIRSFQVNRRGGMTERDRMPTGLTPHVVGVRDGTVLVSNMGEQSISMFEVDRRGELTQGTTIPVDATPQTIAWYGRQAFVALDKPFPQEDVIRRFHVRRDGEVVQHEDTQAGVFLTDIEANADGVFAVTANLNNPADPTDDRDEVRAYRRDGSALVLDATIQTPGFPPSFKQIAARRGRGGIWHLLVTGFQAGYLRSLIYAPGVP